MVESEVDAAAEIRGALVRFEEKLRRLDVERQPDRREDSDLASLSETEYVAYLASGAGTPFGQAFAAFRTLALELVTAFVHGTASSRASLVEAFGDKLYCSLQLHELADEYTWRLVKAEVKAKPALLQTILGFVTLAGYRLVSVDTLHTLNDAWDDALETGLDPRPLFVEAAGRATEGSMANFLRRFEDDSRRV